MGAMGAVTMAESDVTMCEVAKCFIKVWRFRGLRLTIGGVNTTVICAVFAGNTHKHTGMVFSS